MARDTQRAEILATSIVNSTRNAADRAIKLFGTIGRTHPIEYAEKSLTAILVGGTFFGSWDR